MNYSGLIKLLTSGALNLLITLIGTPFLLRIYSISAFADLALIGAITSVSSVLLTLQSSQLIMLAKSDVCAKKNLERVMGFTIISGFLFSLAFLLTAKFFFESLNIEFHLVYFLTSPMVVAITSFENIKIYLSRIGEYKWLSLSPLILLLTNFTLAFIIRGMLGQNGLIYAQLVSYLIVSLFLCMTYRMRIEWRINKIQKFLVKNRSIIYYNFPSEILGRLIGNTPQILISSLYGINALGYYDVAMRIVGLPFKLINASLGEVFKRDAIEQVSKGKSFQIQFNKYFLSLLTLCCIIFLPVALMSQKILMLYAGEKWLGATFVLRMAAVLYFFKTLASPLSYSFILRSKFSSDFYLHLLMFISWITAVIICNVEKTDYHNFITVTFMVLMLFYIVSLIYSERYAKSH